MLENVFRHSVNSEGLFKAEETRLLDYVTHKLPALRYAGGRTSFGVRRYEFTAEEPQFILDCLNKRTTDLLDIAMKAPVGYHCTTSRTENGLAITIPRKDKETLWLGDGIQIMQETAKTENELLAYVGEQEDGRPAIIDFNSVPHWMVAGTTGSGKSVCLTDIIMSMLDRYEPDELNLYLADDKAGITHYDGVPHVKKQASDPTTILGLLQEVAGILKKRKKLLDGRSINYYNRTQENKLPKAVVIFDEADNIIGKGTNAVSDEAREIVRKIAAEGRSLGVHIILASQKPIGSNIDTKIKSDVPGRIALKVTNQQDSRNIIDKKGAEKLLGQGDAYFREITDNNIRMQCAYASEEEIEKAKEVMRQYYNVRK